MSQTRLRFRSGITKLQEVKKLPNLLSKLSALAYIKRYLFNNMHVSDDSVEINKEIDGYYLRKIDTLHDIPEDSWSIIGSHNSGDKLVSTYAFYSLVYRKGDYLYSPYIFSETNASDQNRIMLGFSERRLGFITTVNASQFDVFTIRDNELPLLKSCQLIEPFCITSVDNLSVIGRTS